MPCNKLVKFQSRSELIHLVPNQKLLNLVIIHSNQIPPSHSLIFPGNQSLFSPNSAILILTLKTYPIYTRSSSSLPLKGKHHLTNTKSSTNKQIKRGLSALDVINKQKIIVLRREKSIAYQTTNHKSLKQPIKPKKHSKKQSSNNLHKDNSVNEKHSIMKKRLLASLNITSSNHNDQANNSNIQLISTTSSTTSGVELSSKNSTNGANSVHYDDSSDNVHRIDLKNTNKVNQLSFLIIFFFNK